MDQRQRRTRALPGAPRERHPVPGERRLAPRERPGPGLAGPPPVGPGDPGERLVVPSDRLTLTGERPAIPRERPPLAPPPSKRRWLFVALTGFVLLAAAGAIAFVPRSNTTGSVDSLALAQQQLANCQALAARTTGAEHDRAV